MRSAKWPAAASIPACWSAELAPKIRAVQLRDLEPGRYQITAWLRGLDIGTGTWNATTEFMFDGKYMQLQKNGTFGWTKLTYVADVTRRSKPARRSACSRRATSGSTTCRW